ncbi:hypothetical protein [Flavobacterium sp. H4147]|uniref:hypothetical protein n=1 Tax=Flavobacterium sp. H4147 TaxID=3034149 RepID=UPI0023ED30B2|nr:hypothetical protein [Flavobacterium sp. H4147]
MKKNSFITSKVLFFFLLIFISCEKVDCRKLISIYRKGSFNIVVKETPLPFSKHNFYITGKSLNTNKDTIYDEENRWLCDYYKEIEIGDTIRKKENEAILSIFKKDTVLNLQFNCNGTNYN